MLVLITILSIIELDLDSDQVLVHPLNHMLVLPLYHHLVLVSVVDTVKDILSIGKTRFLVVVLILNSCFICLGLFEFSLHTGTRTDIEVFESGEVMLTCLIFSSVCFSKTVLWMLSYFWRMRLKVALTSLFSSSPNSQEGITLLGSRRVLLGTKLYWALQSSSLLNSNSN